MNSDMSLIWGNLARQLQHLILCCLTRIGRGCIVYTFNSDTTLHGQIGGNRGINSTRQHNHRLSAHTNRISAGSLNPSGHDICIVLMHLNLNTQLRLSDIDLQLGVAAKFRRQPHGWISSEIHRKQLMTSAGFNFKGGCITFLRHLQRRLLHCLNIGIHTNRKGKGGNTKYLLQMLTDSVRILAVQQDIQTVMRTLIAQFVIITQRILYIC